MSTTQAIQQNRPSPLVEAAKKKIATFRQLLDQSKGQIANALPRHIDADKMMRVVMTSLQKNPALMDCDQGSVIGAVIEASQLGLMPDGILGEAYLVPYKGKCQLQPGYRGLISLARRSGEVSDVYAELVFSCDKFRVTYGLNKTLDHEPSLEHEDYWKVDAKGDMPTLIGAYAVVVFKDGTRNFVYMPRKRLNQIRATSQSLNSNFSPWKTAVGAPEMYRKCPIRQLAKMLPLSTEFQKAAMLDEYADAGVVQGVEFNIDANSETARLATENKTNDIVNKYTPEIESQETGHDPAEESQEVHEPTMAESLAAMQERVDEAQRQANETGESVSIEFLGRPMVIDPETQPDPHQTPAEQTSAQPQASGKEHESQPSAKSGGSQRKSKETVQGVPLSFKD